MATGGPTWPETCGNERETRRFQNRGQRTYGDGLFPKSIRVDQGSELVSRDLDLWAYLHGVTLDFSRPGKPTDTDVIEKPPYDIPDASAA